MKRSTVSAFFPCGIQRVWEVVTNNQDISWRRDVSRVDVSQEGKRFVEYTKDGFPTTFTVTLKNLPLRYEFDIENKNMRGHWTGIFRSEGGGTRIEFTEEVHVKNPILNLFVGSYLKKQQAAYVADLKKALTV